MQTRSYLPLSILVVILFTNAEVVAEEIADRSPSQLAEKIDQLITAHLARKEITLPAEATDSQFLRRITLDLAGRIPTRGELEDFLSLPEDSRRSTVIEHLLQLPDFAFHQANEVDLLLLARIKKDQEWRSFLLESVRDNRSWDQLFTDVMTPEISQPGETGPAAFLRERVRELDDMTNDTAVLFFGVNISCAKCHDHPLVADWEQKHYFGMTQFFKRTFQTKSKLLAEDFRGDVKFTDILGDEHNASFMFLNNSTVAEPPLTLDQESEKALKNAVQSSKKDEEAPPPEIPFRPRQQFVNLALSDNDNQFLAKNIVNRIWARFIGRGLVMPLDQMHSDNPPSHPELLECMTRDLIDNGYDLKRLIEAIVRSETYARSSRWDHGETPSPETFAVAAMRPLTPRQLALSLEVASRNPQQLPGLVKPAKWDEKRAELEKHADGAADWFQIPEENFQIGTDEALLFSNSDRFENAYLRTSNDRLVGYLMQLDDPQQQVSVAYESVLSRLPNSIENSAMLDYLNARQDRPEAAIKQIVWVLLSSPEFRFNH